VEHRPFLLLAPRLIQKQNPRNMLRVFSETVGGSVVHSRWQNYALATSTVRGPPVHPVLSTSRSPSAFLPLGGHTALPFRGLRCPAPLFNCRGRYHGFTVAEQVGLRVYWKALAAQERKEAQNPV
jgi:hypothetical protein